MMLVKMLVLRLGLEKERRGKEKLGAAQVKKERKQHESFPTENSKDSKTLTEGVT